MWSEIICPFPNFHFFTAGYPHNTIISNFSARRMLFDRFSCHREKGNRQYFPSAIISAWFDLISRGPQLPYCKYLFREHDGFLAWRLIQYHWTLVGGIHQSPVDSLTKGQWYDNQEPHSVWFTKLFSAPIVNTRMNPDTTKWMHLRKHILLCKLAAIVQLFMVRISLQWRLNGRDCVSNHQPHDCFLNSVI